MLARTNQSLARCDSPEALYREICELVVETAQLRFAWIGTRHLGAVRPVATAGAGCGYLEELEQTGLMVTLDPSELRGQGPTGRALSTGVRTVVNDFTTAPSTAPWHAAARRAGFLASASFPIRERGVITAALTAYADRMGYFTAPLVETLGEIMPALSVALDRFSLEAQCTEQKHMLDIWERALAAAGHSFIIADALAHDQPVIYASQAFEALTGYGPADIRGRNCRILQGDETDATTVRRLGEAIRAGDPCTVELLNYRRDGQPFWNQLTVVPVRDERGTITHYVGEQRCIDR